MKAPSALTMNLERLICGTEKIKTSKNNPMEEQDIKEDHIMTGVCLNITTYTGI